MKYHNPIITGFYPDPSVTKGKDNYYLVASSFDYFPGVPILESRDLINWTAIGSVLTRDSQLDLAGTNTKSGIYAPTIRYHNGIYYMVTTNVSHGGHFFVTSKDPHQGWGDPIWVDQEGIDPSLFFDGDKAYFMSTAKKDSRDSILVSEIDLKTGEVANGHHVWFGNGGRYLEGPHLYKINGYYYLLASEGGTEYGHMLVVARSENIWGPYESDPENPILTNRNLGGYQLQGAGHGDLIQDKNKDWWVIFLGFRQIPAGQFHTLGREVNILPVEFKDNWPIIGKNKTATLTFETDRINVKQTPIESLLQKKAKVGKDLFYLRNPDYSKYNLTSDKYVLKTSQFSLDQKEGSPTVLFTRQRSFHDNFAVKINPNESVAGITAYLEADQHYDLLLKKIGNEQYCVQLRLVIGQAKAIVRNVTFENESYPEAGIDCSPNDYKFFVETKTKKIDLGSYEARFLSSEVADNFTGVMFGIFVEPDEEDKNAEFYELSRKM